MSQRPPLVPKDAPGPDSPLRTQPVRRVRRRRGPLIAVLLFALLVMTVGWISTAVLIAYRPDVLGYDELGDLTQKAIVFGGTGVAQQATATALDATALFVAGQNLANAETQAALVNRAQDLDRQATQAQIDAQATQTAVAAEGARQATRAAVDFAGTQAAFDRQATQAELEFQGTQAALNRDATAVALGFATVPPDTLPTIAPQPTPVFSEGFTTGLDTERWRSSGAGDWSVGEGRALVAARDGAWLLTQRRDLQSYGFVMSFAPVPGEAGYHYVLLNITPEGNGLAVELYFDGTQATSVALFEVSEADVLRGPLWGQDIGALATAPLAAAPSPADGTLTVQVEARGRIVVYVERQAFIDLLTDAPLPPGAVGVQMPAGAQVRRLTLLP